MGSTETIAIAAPGLSAEISPQGAELVRLVDAGGRDLLWDGDPAFWTGRAPLLFPIVGALSHDRYRLGDVEYALPRHGFARRSAFTVVAQSPSSVTLRLSSGSATVAVYPFAFILDVTFAVEGSSLSVAATLSNVDETPLPASFGFHPALRWPLPYGRPRAEHRVVFEADEPAPIRRLGADGCVEAADRPSPIDGRTLALDDGLFVDDAVILDCVASRRVVYGAPGAPTISVAFPDMPYLGLWSKPGAGFVCIEPWHGIADPAGFAGDFREKPGIVLVPPGERHSFRMSITLSDPAASGEA